MKKSNKFALIVFFALIVAAIPLYYLALPDASQPEETLLIKGKVNCPTNVTFTELESFQAVTLHVTLTSSSRLKDNGDFNYTGVRLNDLLNLVEPYENATSIYIQASDGYGTTLSLQEARGENVIIAYLKDGQKLSLLKDGGEGPLRLIIGDDEFAQRWTRGVVVIEAR
ncbi:MAG: molybdopterin-dependent oxidoreductase [Candidatus Bathyarchaeota archaeon]|nr:molybdopterin-dependent oxidoreductase [Candidatus Bathyarchaeota archaeon]